MMEAISMFIVEEEALQYIKLRSGSVLIDLTIAPAVGGWCPSKDVTVRYVPKLTTREPLADERQGYKVIDQDGIKLYYSSKLKVSDGYSEIIIKLRKLLFFKWLEIEGATLAH